MADLPIPAYTPDDPLMQAMFVAFAEHAWGKDDAHAAFCEATGRSRPTAPRNGLEAAIDKATGYVEEYARDFLEWLIINHWGVDGDPALEETEH